jgi:hypothetical protein
MGNIIQPHLLPDQRHDGYDTAHAIKGVVVRALTSARMSTSTRTSGYRQLLPVGVIQSSADIALPHLLPDQRHDNYGKAHAIKGVVVRALVQG